MDKNSKFEVTIHPLDKGARVEVRIPDRPLDRNVYRSMSEAQTAAEIISERLSGNAEPVTFAEFSDFYIDRHVKAELAPHTLEQYRSKIERFMPHLGTVPLKDITPTAIWTALLALSRYSKARNRLLGELRRVLNWAVKWYFIEANPADKVEEEDEFGEGHE
jgi:hypothetical protein